MDQYEKKNSFRKPLFNFYMDRGYSAVENFQAFNRLMGISAVLLSVAAGGPIGIELGVVAAGAGITNEVRLSKLKHQVHLEHQGVIKSVYDSQEK